METSNPVKHEGVPFEKSAIRDPESLTNPAGHSVLAEGNTLRKYLEEIAAFFTAFLIVVLVFGMLGFFGFQIGRDYALWGTFHNPKVTSCGTSAAEAAALGCKYDLMSFAWMPPSCFDEALTNDFITERNWTWYLDPLAQRPVSQDKVQQGGFERIYVDSEYLRHHCIYTWEKLTRAVESAGFVDGYVQDTDHAQQCSVELSKWPSDGNETLAEIYTKFPYCGTKHKGFRGWYVVIDGMKVYRDPGFIGAETVNSELSAA